MPIVGTAGHVDHGKSTLVRALTGIDPDRWAEEKERGLTIDLGFAWTDLGGRDVGFVDVPGHERFVKNMLAGVGVIDCALFVVAADGGWMPQSEEHAAVLDLLGVDRGVIALSRIDLVDADTRDIATLEILDRIHGLSLESWVIVPVSPVTGEGMDELRHAIAGVLDAAPERSTEHFRMWVDRAFRPSGAGLVVTGTVLEGRVVVGDTLIMLPGGTTATVRGIQHHGANVDVGHAGSRTALNLTGASHDVRRGTLLSGHDEVAVTDRMLASFRPTRGFESIPARGAFHLHVGTSSTPATIRRIRGTEAFVVHPDEAIPAVMGDRVILRDSGRRAVVGGGSILDPLPFDHPTPEMVARIEAAVAGSRADRADALVAVHGSIDRDTLRRSTGGGHPTRAVRAGSLWVSAGELGALGERIGRLVSDYHGRHPARPGMPKGEVASRIGVTTDVVDAVVHHISDLREVAGAVARTSFEHTIDEAQQAAWDHVRASLESSFDVPRASAIDVDEELLHFLIRRGDLVRITDDLVFTRDQTDEISERVAELPDGFTVAEFRDHFGMARRQAVPTLEWLDRRGRTRRTGDGRSVRR